MLRRALAVSVSACLTLGLAQGAVAAPTDPAPPLVPEAAEVTGRTALEKGTVMTLGAATEQPELYIVQLEEPAAPAYEGGVEGIPSAKADLRAGEKFDASAAAPTEYREHLVQEQSELTAAIAREVGREPAVRFTYTNALNGVAVELTRDEARATAELPGVVSVTVDETRELQTDVGPEWIGAPAIWGPEGAPAATPDGTGTKGEGIIAGIIDSGINPANPSFADSVPESEGGDGYDHTSPLPPGEYLGFCDPANAGQYDPQFECNDKLIGAYAFDVRDTFIPFDDNGHGSHTASTTAGNQVNATTYSAEGDERFEFSATRQISGVAPHSNIISYDVCASNCSGAAITAAIDQAIEDGVDVINYSIGSPSPSDPWSDADAIGYLNARTAGIYVATSAGNSGPGEATVGSPGDVPWMTTVGAVQHNRQWQSDVVDIVADAGTYGPIDGLAFSAPSGGTAAADTPVSYPLVYAGDIGSPLCIEGELDEADVAGNIIVCDRGTTGRVQKGEVVAALGAEGMVLANEEASGDSRNADAHALPASNISYDDGVALKTWMASVEGETAAITGGQEVISDNLGDIMAGFSSRGPNRAVDIVSPSVSAPGVDVLAAYGADNAVKWAFVSGTSMASPHVAGSYALLKAVHGDDWTPAEAQSALMMTSTTEVTDTNGTPADWFDMGSGREDLTVAANAGLVMDETTADYLAANPAEGGDVKELNLASMADSQCLQTCSWTRTVTGTSTGIGTWSAAGSGVTDDVEVSVSPATFEITEVDQEVELTVTADVTGAGTEDYQFGNVSLTHAAGSAPEAHLPVAVLPSTGVLPDEVAIDTRRDAGSQESAPIEAIEVTDLDAQVSGLTPMEERELSIVEDDTNTDPYDGNGTQTTLVEVPEGGGARLIARLADSTAPDMDLFVGTGDTPSDETEVCASATATADELCDVGNPEAGTWWIVTQNWQASAPGGTDTVTLGTAVVAGDKGNMRVEGPESNPTGEPFTLRVFYDEPELDAGETWYGAITLGSSPDSPGDIGTIPVILNRFADDVTKVASTETAAPGDTVDYTITVQPNVTPEDLEYSITDTLPEGTTYVEGSASDGATVTDGVLSWQGTMPTAVGAQGSYDITTSADDESCFVPFGDGGYVDLEALGISANPGFTGDGTGLTFSAELGFFGDVYDAFTVTDDGYTVFDAAQNWAPSMAPGTPQSLPDPTLPSNLAAPLWSDYEIVYDQANNTGVSVATLTSGGVPSASIIEYDNPVNADGTTPGDFETFIWYDVSDAEGEYEIFYAYDSIESLPATTTIGAENADGTIGSALVNNGSPVGTIENDTIVCLDYVGPELGAEEISYQVTVDDTVADGQVLTNEVAHITDNPGAEEVTTSVDVVAAVASVVTVETTQDAEEPSTDGVFTFNRPEGASAEELTVAYSVTDNRWANAGRDYEPLDGTVTFAAGESTATETVEVIDVRRHNPKERTVTVTVEPSDSYEVGDPSSATMQIVDDWRPGRP